MKMYSVFDKKASFFSIPFPAKTQGEAVRTVGDAVNTPGTLLSMHPGDFALYQTGSFDEESGIFETSNPVHITEVAALVRCAADA